MYWDGCARAAATESEQAEGYLKEIDARVNAPGLFWFSLLASLGLNVYIFIRNGEEWNGPWGGLPSYWFRLVTVGSFYVIFHVLLKGIAVVSVIRRLFATERPAESAGARKGLLDRGMARVFSFLGRGVRWLLWRLGFLRGAPFQPLS